MLTACAGGDLALVILHQHLAPQLRPEMAADALGAATPRCDSRGSLLKMVLLSPRPRLLYLVNDKRLSVSSINVAVAASRLFYTVSLEQHWIIDDNIPTGRRGNKLSIVLSQEELGRFLAPAENLKHRRALTICYDIGSRAPHTFG
jgi:hypothetical protein